MNESNNPYRPYSYDPYDQAPRAPEAPAAPPGIAEKIFGSEMAEKLRSPAFATGALLLAGVAFAAIIVSSYPDEGADAESLPVIKAETTAFREAPADPGGMDVANKQSTVFMIMRDGQMQEAQGNVENLLAPDEAEEPVDKLAEFAQEAETLMDITESVEGEEAGTTTSGEAAPPVETLAQSDIDKPKIQSVETQVEKVPPQQLVESAQSEPRPHKQQVLHAGSSPDTIAFVKSVLDKKDGLKALDAAPSNDAAQAPPPSEVAANTATAERLAAIEPAVGAAKTITPGDYFVQLASVTSESGAGTEWGKLQKKFSAELSNVDYRVQEANLGERGIYYRIQAGPMSKDSANSMCDAIKAQKPGGCLVVK